MAYNELIKNFEKVRAYRDWSETDRVEDLDGSGEGRSDGDRPAARI